MKKETKKSVVEQAAVALRLWSNAWREFDKTGKNKPETFEEVIKPFIEMEKEQKIKFACEIAEASPEIGQVGITKYNTTYHIAGKYHNKTF